MHRIVAAITFFTRLPLWRIVNLSKQDYERVVPLWPFAGWLTGGTMALVFWIAHMMFPISVSVVLTLMSRVLLTGALHEDGFADFCDGFGGGTDKTHILAIMKDSHVGTYGMLGLVFYYLLMGSTLISLLPIVSSPLIFIAADSLCKFFSSTIIWFLPYARTEAEAKNQLIYTQVTWWEILISITCGILPSLLLLSIHSVLLPMALSALTSILVCAGLFVFMHKRIQGYTGDCCGATFLICELVFYLTWLACLHLG